MPPAQQAAHRIEDADFGDDAVDHAIAGAEKVDYTREVGGLEDVYGLLLDDDLAGAGEVERALAVGDDDAAVEQGGFGLALSPGARYAVMRPDAELGVVFGMGVGGGDDGDAVGGGVAIEAGDGGRDALGAGDVE